MREWLGAALFVIGAVGAATALLAPIALWDYLDPNPGGRLESMLFLFSGALMLAGLLLGLSRQATRLFPK
jgi:hypothetical protein